MRFTGGLSFINIHTIAIPAELYFCGERGMVRANMTRSAEYSKPTGVVPSCKFTKLLAANRSEIAIRIFRAATDLGLRTVAIYAQEDRFSIHRFKADEAYQVGAGKGPVAAYLDIDGIVALAKENRGGGDPPGLWFPERERGVCPGVRPGGDHLCGPAPGIAGHDGGQNRRARAGATHQGADAAGHARSR